MKSIRIEGLRSLKDSGFIPINPLTIFLGENSSGKSTFLRSFPLLRQSIESTTRGPILWYGSYVDFGLFEDALSKFSEDKIISFSFKLDSDELYGNLSKRYYRLAGIKDDEIIAKLSVISDTKEKSTRVLSVEISTKSNSAKATYSKSGKIIEFISNDIDITDLFANASSVSNESSYSLFPIIRFTPDDTAFYSPVSEFRNSLLDERTCLSLVPYLHQRNDKKEYLEKVRSINFSNEHEFLHNFKKLSSNVTWTKRTKSLSIGDDKFHNMRSLLFANQFPWLVFLINHNLAEQLYNVKYIAPLRATAERYYRAQDLSVKEVDFQGKNLAMFIKNLSDKEKANYSEWLKDNFGFNLLSISIGGHLSLRLQYNDSDSSYNITDMGFGFSQILPIITQLWYSTNEKPKAQSPYNRGSKSVYLIIEQPELHLHPRFQAKMVDVFVRAINLAKNQKSNIFIIIETHSETIINQVGHRISKAMLDKDDVSITIFDKKSPDSPTNVRVSSYDSNGYLNDWPWGFFEPELS